MLFSERFVKSAWPFWAIVGKLRTGKSLTKTLLTVDTSALGQGKYYSWHSRSAVNQPQIYFVISGALFSGV